MLLKKQTVWLLTMLSLVVVLSVYYVTSDPKQSDMATVEKNDANKKETAKKEAAKKDENMNVVTNPADGEVFEQIRLDRQTARSEERENLTEKLASDNLSADEKSELKDEMNKLTEIAQKEKILENLIKSKGYEDVLVQADGTEMKITVRAKDHDAKAANQIVRLVTEQLGSIQNVTVGFQQ